MELDSAVKSLSALGEPSRLSIFRLLVETGHAGLVVGQLIERLAIAPPTLSFHLKTLHHAGLIRSRKERQFVRYVANFDAMNGLVAYLTEHCCGGHPELCAPGACGPETRPTAEPATESAAESLIEPAIEPDESTKHAA